MAKKSCQRGSVTDHWDDCVDRCGCKYPQGWSSTSHHCKTGSATDSHEKCDGGGGNDGFYCNPHASCPSELQQHHHGNGACLIKDNGKVYLNVMTGYCWNCKGKYDLPGGTNDKPGGESQQCVAYRETCEEADFKVNVGRRLNDCVFECTIVNGTNRVPHSLSPGEVDHGVWLTYSEAKKAGRYAYRRNGYAWCGLWKLIESL